MGAGMSTILLDAQRFVKCIITVAKHRLLIVYPTRGRISDDALRDQLHAQTEQALDT